MLDLIRVTTGINGTFGVLLREGVPLCVTCEDPDYDNRKNISCIPEGTYSVVPHYGTKYQNVWRLENVPNREAILIHAGNTIEHTQGCILVGTSFGMFGDIPGIVGSKQALDYLRKILPKNFTLTIKGV